MNTKMKVVVDGNFLNYGGTILNRAEVAEADTLNGMVIMRSGHQYFLEPNALCAWFSDTMDYSKPPVGKGGKPDERAIREVVECAARVIMPPSDSTDGAWLEWARSLQAKARRALGMEVRE